MKTNWSRVLRSICLLSIFHFAAFRYSYTTYYYSYRKNVTDQIEHIVQEKVVETTSHIESIKPLVASSEFLTKMLFLPLGEIMLYVYPIDVPKSDYYRYQILPLPLLAINSLAASGLIYFGYLLALRFWRGRGVDTHDSDLVPQSAYRMLDDFKEGLGRQVSISAQLVLLAACHCLTTYALFFVLVAVSMDSHNYFLKLVMMSLQVLSWAFYAPMVLIDPLKLSIQVLAPINSGVVCLSLSYLYVVGKKRRERK